MESGLRLTERYRLVDRLDGGGTNAFPPVERCSLEVWRAWDELLGRPVAVKLLAPAHSGLHRTFQKGVNRAAGLSHAALERVYDSDRTRDASGRLVSYVVTEFLGGETLAEHLRTGPLTASETSRICAQIAGALEAAHKAGVPHGDLRPGKILLLYGDVKVVDTGIAGIVRRVREPSGTETAPLSAGAAAAEAAAADIRALGAVISACLPEAAPADLTALAARCAAATAGDGPSATEIAALLTRDDGPRGPVFANGGRVGPSHDHRTRALRVPARPSRKGARLAASALVVAIPATAAAAMLLSAPRTPVTVPPPPAGADATPVPESPPPGRDARAAEPAVAGALERLRPIVDRGYSAGEIRSDVAIDLTNVITNLENDLTAGREVDVEQRIDLLQEKIATRRSERGLSPDLADELNRVLATIQS
ncbi:protein kinase [Actinomadura sp. KC345]|uniref:protein kinase domain-containing protein n=1 Tax=Actinomadura sp. KC345 TaxID=2530371 RepID=UPI0014050C8E|nr:protein kinase [Actinomadura sp. KC345]